ncbi:hypothetical protein [Hymenobacter glacialis]|uniref:Uncharacterized protein n=1 Tax=Hymenobacter glacialis TaxID=1908236 RepID=A0A1G1SX70_9BACT|nr:hypothetical protein [Hymenobacter glacialis]OGX83202.1 hypothetical protein BEN48_17285 [Hymenobacter glacialis]
MLISFAVKGKAGLRFSSGEIALPAIYDATWRISPQLYGFRSGERYGILSNTGRQVQACALSSLYVGFREVTPATVLNWVSEHGIGNLPPLQWVLGRLCHADLLRAEEVTPQLWKSGQLRHVLSSGDIVHITPAQRCDTMPGGLYAAEATALRETVLVLTESTQLLSMTLQACVESAITVELPETLRGTPAPLSPAQEERWAFCRQLRALLTSKGIAPITYRPAPELVGDYLPYEVLRLPEDTVRRCRDHVEARLDAGTSQEEAKTWQLIFLAWLAANDYILYCAETGAFIVSELFVFDGSPFGNRTASELLDEYELWSLAPWLRDESRFL